MSLLKSCRFEICCSGEKSQGHVQTILNLGFNIVKPEKNVLSCEIINPTRDRINTFLDVVEGIKEPGESDDYNDDESFDSFLVLPIGSDIHQNHIHLYGPREPEEGGEEDTDEKNDSLSCQDIEIVSQDDITDLHASRDQKQILKDYENETSKKMFGNGDGCEIDSGQAEKLEYYGQHNERKQKDRTETHEKYKYKVNFSQTGMEAAHGEFYSDSCHDHMTKEVPNPNPPCAVKEKNRTKDGVQEENIGPSKEPKFDKQLKDKGKTGETLEHEIHGVEFNATSENLIPQNQAAENFAQHARDASSDRPMQRRGPNQKKALKVSETKGNEAKEDKPVVDIDMKDVSGEFPSNKLCGNSNYERTSNDNHSIHTEDKCFGKTNKAKKTKSQPMSSDSKEEKNHLEVANDDRHVVDDHSLGRDTMKSSQEGTDDERKKTTHKESIDNVQQINKEAIQVTENDELKVENMASRSDDKSSDDHNEVEQDVDGTKVRESKFQGEDDLSTCKPDAKKKEHGNETHDDHVECNHEPEKEKKSKCLEVVTHDDNNYNHNAADDDDDDDDYQPRQIENESNSKRENDSLISKMEAEKGHKVTHDDDDHVDSNYKFEQEENKSQPNRAEVVKISFDNDDDDDDYHSATDDSDDDGGGEDDDEREEENARFSNIPFGKGGYELALKVLENSKSIEYLRKPEIQNSWRIIKVDDQQCTKELINFKNELIETKIPTDKHGLLMEVNRRWKSQIVAEHFSEYILLTSTKDIYAEIRNEFPMLYETEPTHQHSASNISKEETAKKKAMQADKQGKEGQMASAQRMRKDEFEGHLSKLTVKIKMENITLLPVDVIVNAANYRLNNTGGVAKVIAKAAGKKLREECEKYISNNTKIDVTEHFASSGGNLNAKQVYHAVGPKFSFYKTRHDDCKQDLRLTILRCLCHAEVEGYRSIAFPSISASLFQVPKEFCVESYMKAVQHFELIRNHHNVEKLEEVYFVDIDDNMVNAIKQHFAQNWDLHNISRDELRKDEINVEKYFARNRSARRDGNPSNAGTSGSSSHGVGSTGVGAKQKTSWLFGSSSHGVGSTGVGAKQKTSWLPSWVSWSTEQTENECDICKEERMEFTKFQCCDKKVCNNCHQKMQRCPYCMTIYGTFTGDQPKGFMRVENKTSSYLAGYSKCKGLYEISYFFNEVSYSTPFRIAYIPATDDGLGVVKFLMLAFRRRLTFTKGRSVTTGRENQITWNDIHHKTSLIKDSSHGYPDSSYLTRLRDELRSKGVTKDSMTPDEKSVIKRSVKQLKEKLVVKVDCYGI